MSLEPSPAAWRRFGVLANSALQRLAEHEASLLDSPASEVSPPVSSAAGAFSSVATDSGSVATGTLLAA